MLKLYFLKNNFALIRSVSIHLDHLQGITEQILMYLKTSVFYVGFIVNQ
jgi:hypothetical protein